MSATMMERELSVVRLLQSLPDILEEDEKTNGVYSDYGT